MKSTNTIMYSNKNKDTKKLRGGGESKNGKSVHCHNFLIGYKELWKYYYVI